MPAKGPDLKICKGYLLHAAFNSLQCFYHSLYYSKHLIIPISQNLEDTWNSIPQETIQGQVQMKIKLLPNVQVVLFLSG